MASRLNPIEDPSSPYYLHHSENHSSVIVTPELTSTDFTSWKRSFLLVVSIRNKQGFLDVSIAKPDPEGPLYLPWIRCNNLIVAWLLCSISPSIASTVFYMEDAHLIWNTLLQRFSQCDESRICHLQHLLCTINQGMKSVDSYFTELNGVWEELRNFRPLPHCVCGSCNKACFQKFVDAQFKDYVFRFLNGLNESYQALRTQIILVQPFSTLDQVYNMVLREETQRSVCIQTQNLSEMSAMAVKRGDKSEVVCSYCGKPRHTRDKCYKLNGFPPGFKFTKSKTSGANPNHGSVNQVFSEQPKVNADQEPMDQSVQLSFSKEQVQKLMALLNDHSLLDSQPKSTNSPTHLANFAGIHSIFSAINSTTFHNLLRTKFVASPWIIDIGATDHIICSLTLFDSYVPLQNAFVHLPNGMKVQVTHIGTVILNSHIVLHNVLLVPTFTFNLLSASKLTSTKKDCLIVLSNCCVI